MQALNDVNLRHPRRRVLRLPRRERRRQDDAVQDPGDAGQPRPGNGHRGRLDVATQAADVRRVLTPVIADERSLRWRLSARENLRLYAVLYGLPAKGRRASRRSADRRPGPATQDGRAILVGHASAAADRPGADPTAAHPAPRRADAQPRSGLGPDAARVSARRNLQRLGCTILLATHTAEEAFELCDRVAILDHGQPVAIGRPTSCSSSSAKTTTCCGREAPIIRPSTCWLAVASSGTP